MPNIYKGLHEAQLADRDRRLYNAKTILSHVRNVIGAFHSFADFGCGIGAWLVAAQELGAANVVGVEGQWIDTVEIMADRSSVVLADLSSGPYLLTETRDLCVSIEVAEHLPESAADYLVDSLVAASGAVLFSAARRGQRGVGHINCQDLDYWAQKFWQRGYQAFDVVRPHIRNDPQIYVWLKRNVVLYLSVPRVRSAAKWALPFARQVSELR